MKIRNLGILFLIVVALIWLASGISNENESIEQSTTEYRMQVNGSHDGHSYTVAEDEAARFDFLNDEDPVHSLNLSLNGLEGMRQRTIQILSALSGSGANVLLNDGTENKESIQWIQRYEELQNRDSSTLNRAEQIELTQMQIRKKSDLLAIQRKAFSLYGDDAPLGPAGDYHAEFRRLEADIQKLRSKLDSLESSY